MLEREHGDIIWQCDGCGELLDTNTADFDAARNMLTRNQWLTKRASDGWQHFCSDCSKRV